MSWLVDTDVLSQPAKYQGDERVIAWLKQEKDRCYTSAVVIAQLAYWVRTKQGNSRALLQAWLTKLVASMQGRILNFNTSVAHCWADQEFAFEQAGKQMPVEDGYIAATARKYGLTIVTGNEKDFSRPGVKVFNPFRQT
jgi:predicted nucleic acid-binding protein